MDWLQNGFLISTDMQKLDLDVICDFLSTAYWSNGRPRNVIEKSIEQSLNFGVYLENKQIGFARVVTDYATMYWICDVFILEEFRGKGLGKWLVKCVVGHPELEPLLGILATTDAQGLYERYGFKEPSDQRRLLRKDRFS